MSNSSLFLVVLASAFAGCSAVTEVDVDRLAGASSDGDTDVDADSDTDVDDDSDSDVDVDVDSDIDVDSDTDVDADTDGDGDVGCPERRVRCGDSCFDLSADRDHCGACDRRCEDGESCESGQCRCVGDGCGCPEGLTDCDGGGPFDCRDLDHDFWNCGECGRVCPFGTDCDSGDCRCPDGLTDCGWGDNVECRDTDSDPFNCGGCDWSCDAGDAICVDGSCGYPAMMCEWCGENERCCEVRQILYCFPEHDAPCED